MQKRNLVKLPYSAQNCYLEPRALSLNHLLLRLISTLLKFEISTLMKTIPNSCFQALEGWLIDYQTICECRT